MHEHMYLSENANVYTHSRAHFREYVEYTYCIKFSNAMHVATDVEKESVKMAMKKRDNKYSHICILTKKKKRKIYMNGS